MNQDGGESSRDYAAAKGSAEMVTVLVAANANLDLVDKVSAWGRQRKKLKCWFRRKKTHTLGLSVLMVKSGKE